MSLGAVNRNNGESNAFSDAWEALSPVQKQAAQWDKGPMLVLAGPGSGKTRVLTCRIASLLDSTRDQKFRILGLTFTNKAADEMRGRVDNFVPGQKDRLFLGTFHSFCADVLRQHGTHLNIKPDFTIYSQNEDLRLILDEAVEKAKKKSRVVSDLDKKTLPVIQKLKSFLVMPEDCRQKFEDASFGERTAAVYSAYEAELSNRNALDFNSLIFKVWQLFTKFPAFAKRYRTVYKYICIDEFQDTNHAQYSLIRSLTGDIHRDIFAVADDDQIIYQWNGASHERVKQFITDFSPDIIQLPLNYRCLPEIVVLANNLIRHNFFRTPDKKPLEAFRHPGNEKSVRLLPCFPSFEDEAAGIATDIEHFHHNHLGEVAILGRNRKLLDGVQIALRNRKLPSGIVQRKDAFESTPVVWLHSMLRLANNNMNDAWLEAVCGSFNQLAQLELDPHDVVMRSQENNLGYFQNWINIVRKNGMNDLTGKIIDEAVNCLALNRNFRRFSASAFAWFEKLKDENSSEETFANYEEEHSVWNELMREITDKLGDEISLEAFLQELQMHSKESSPKPNTITLMTIHGAKGKEFEHVYLAGLVEDELPSFQSIKQGDKSPEMEEERRNCYVAITRAIQSLTLSYATEYRGWVKRPSRFLYEMGLLANLP